MDGLSKRANVHNSNLTVGQQSNKNGFGHRFHTRLVKLKPKTVTNCWKEFCTETSLAGFKYLSSDVHFIRRLFWYAICIAFSILTVVQLVQLFVQYSENPIKTLVDRSYPDSVIFPKVIICNTMPFRVSAVRPLSEMHVILSKIYETPLLNTDVARDKKTFAILSKIKNTKKYFHDAGHQMDDVIIGCTWQGRPCSTDNFTEVITEQGICYSFNSDSRNPLHVSHTGADYGLELVLNIARYEEMNGPYKVYGATVTISPQEYPASSRSGINALVGTYTTLSLVHKEINFIEGTSCGEKPLKFFHQYTRQSCILEKNFELIRRECGCYPYIVSLDNSSTNVQTEKLEICNLGQHLSCAQLHIDQPVGATDDECPPACKVSVHSATVSTAEVAWERLQGSFVDRTARMDKISVDLRHAWEVATRYHPKYADPTHLLLETLHSAEQNVSAVIGQINNLTTELPPIPTSNEALPLKENFEKFRTKTFQPVSDLIDRVLGDINRTVEMSSSAFMNHSYVDYLLGNKTLNGTTQGELGLPQNIFNVANGHVYLNTLPAFLQSLDAIKSARNNFLKDWREGFYVLNGKTLLLGNASRLLNSTVDKLMLVVFKQMEFDRQNVSGCLQRQVEYVNVTKFLRGNHSLPHNHTDGYSLMDVFICFQRLFTSPNSVTAQANNIGLFTDGIPTNAVDIDQQSTICKQILCRTFESLDNSNCSISTSELLHMANILDEVVPEAVGQCGDLRDSLKTSMTSLADIYVNSVLTEYSKALDVAKSFAKHNQKILETFSKPLWTNPHDLTHLSSNISNYTSVLTNYTDLANVITGIYSNWLEQTFTFNLNKVKTSLTETLETIDLMETELAKLLNISTLNNEMDMNATANGNGIFAIVTKTVLWENNTADNIQLSLEAMKLLKNLTIPLIAELTRTGEIFSNSLKDLTRDCKKFLTKTQMDQDFFTKNFMVINVNMQELSNEIITQIPAAEFWSLVADLGGAGSFWLGVSLVSFIELMDICIRFGFKCCRIGVRRAVRRLKLGVKNGKKASSPPSTSTAEIEEIRAKAEAAGAVEIDGEFYIPEVVEDESERSSPTTFASQNGSQDELKHREKVWKVAKLQPSA